MMMPSRDTDIPEQPVSEQKEVLPEQEHEASDECWGCGKPEAGCICRFQDPWQPERTVQNTSKSMPPNRNYSKNGWNSHLADKKCYTCGQMGHISRMCRTNLAPPSLLDPERTYMPTLM